MRLLGFVNACVLYMEIVFFLNTIKIILCFKLLRKFKKNNNKIIKIKKRQANKQTKN